MITSSLPSAGADLKEREQMSDVEVGTFVQRLRGLMSEIGESGMEGCPPQQALPLPGPTPSVELNGNTVNCLMRGTWGYIERERHIFSSFFFKKGNYFRHPR